MAEAIHCPSCTTRYRLRPERLKPVFRRAKCFSCGGIFPVGDVVQRLLAPSPESDFPEFSFEDEAELALHPETDAIENSTPSLTLGDLDVADEEILDATLITVPMPLPEAKIEALPSPLPPAPVEAAPLMPNPVAPEPVYPAAITETTLSGYTSARDAIEKLFGSAHAPVSITGPKAQQESSTTDMEATLSALENTLGASPTLPTVSTGTMGDSPTAAGLTDEDLAGPSTSTMRLTQDDLQAILDAAPAPVSAEPTVALRASDLMAAKAQQAAPTSAQGSFASLSDAPDTGTELLRLKIGEDIYGGLTMPQLIAWVEEGRILENHLVARQHSENWLEAHKVPGLRPIFERLRRERSGGAPVLNVDIGEIAPKKSLFGGLFGKG